MLPVELLDILVCPVCKGPLQYDAAALKLNCFPCGLGFPVREGIPVLLADEADVLQKSNNGVSCQD
jgi:uncharacterized protein YbaR (Trm112 family)